MNYVKRQEPVRRALLVSAAIGVLSSAGAAQAQDATVSELVITGSRLPHAASDSPVAVVMVNADALRNSGQPSLGDVISEMPMFGPGVNQQTTSATSFLAGQSRVDLRGMGASRTLVLVDTRRVAASDATSPAFDVNTLPRIMVEHVDILADGASAIYGSEAIAGVVNIVMRNRFEGFQTDVSGGVAEHGGGEEYSVGALFGRKFADDRLSLVIGAEASHSGQINQSDRGWADPGLRRSATTPQTVITNSKTNQSPYATFQLGTTFAVALDARSPTQVVKLSADCSTATVAAACQDPALVYQTDYGLLQGRVDRGAIRSHIDYTISDSVQAFAEASFARVSGYATLSPTFSTATGAAPLAVSITGDNAYLNGPGDTAAQLRAQFLAAGRPLTNATSVRVAKYFAEFGGRDTDARRNSLSLATGMKGDLNAIDRSVHWDWYAQYGRTTGRVLTTGIGNIVRIQQAVDAVVVGGQVVCRSVAAQAAGCVPWDLVNGPSRAAVLWADGASVTREKVEQTVVAGNATTELFTLPAGPIGLAAGVEYRKEKSSAVQDALGASGALFFNAIGTRAGQYHVTEGYAELRVPILKDLPFAKELSVEAAGRLADYSTIGHADQHRLAVAWSPISDILFRASKGSQVRAPNITELYSPQTTSNTLGLVDPCDRTAFAAATAAQQAARRVTCAALIPNYNPATFNSNVVAARSTPLVQGGDPDLGPEIARSYGVGTVVRPRWIPGLQVSLDWFKYNIEGAITPVPPATTLGALCYDSTEDARTNVFCAQAPRDATGATTGLIGGITKVFAVNLNAAKVKIEGYDGSIAYRFRTADHFGADYGDLDLRVDATWTYRWALQGFPGQAYSQLANVVANATPEWKGLGSIAWEKSDLRLQWTVHYIGSMSSTSSFQPSALSPYYTGAYYMHDLRAQYRFKGVEVRGGVLNLTDRNPPALPETYTGTGAGSSLYDNRGRFFYLGASLKY